MRVDLATATASPPPWLAIAHPEILPVTEDGVTLSLRESASLLPELTGVPALRRHASSRRSSQRYADHPALQLWHVNNEYGCHVSHCYCDTSAAAFRAWLEAKYGTIEALNEAWGTAFWSQHYASFDEVLPPRAAPTFKNPTQLLDFDRFSSDELLECYRAEAAIIRRASTVPVTTNFMGFFKHADYWKWAQEVDIVSDDSYPDPADPNSPVYGAMQRDLMRSLGGGEPWLLMEQSPGAVNWRERNAAKLPGQMRAWSYQCIGRGADGILFFQWRQAVAGAEKFHAGMVPHGGTDTRVFREVEALGAELRVLSEIDGLLGATVKASVAIVFDWDAWRAIEQEASPTRVSYVNGVFAWYRALAASGVTVDFVRPDGRLSDYRVVVAPTLIVATDDHLASMDAFVREGGTLVVSYLTGVLDQDLHVRTGGYLGTLRQTLGLWVEEFAPPAAPDLANVGGAVPPPLTVSGDAVGGTATASLWGEYVRIESATVEALFVGNALDGHPAVTRNSHDKGTAWYVATQLDHASLTALLDTAMTAAGVDRLPVVSGVEFVRRGSHLFAINHSAETVTLDIQGTDMLSGKKAPNFELDPRGVAIIAQSGEVE